LSALLFSYLIIVEGLVRVGRAGEEWIMRFSRKATPGFTSGRSAKSTWLDFDECDRETFHRKSDVRKVRKRQARSSDLKNALPCAAQAALPLFAAFPEYDLTASIHVSNERRLLLFA